MEALCPSTSTAPPRAWQNAARAIRKGISRVRPSAAVLGAYVALTGLMLASSAELFQPPALIRSLLPLTIAFLYIYLARSEDMEQNTMERTALGRRETRHTAEKITLLEELKRQQEALDRANRVKDQFLGILSHELRTPLNIIIGYARLLKEQMLGALDPIQAEAVAKIDTHARTHLAKITDLLEITNLNAGQNASRCQQIALSGLLDDLKSDHDIRGGEQVELLWDCPANLPVVETDGEKVKHILRNIIDNAIKFTPCGTVTVAARMIPPPAGSPPEKHYVEFRVSDTGIGMEPEHLSRIFDLFHQIDASTTRAYGGLGLGLHVVRQLAALLGATVEVESSPGCGTTFTVTVGCERSAADKLGKRTARRESVADRDVHLRL